MNRKNFETVLEQYISRLAGLEQADDSDQVYKWRAVGCFKRFWNLDAADFAGMFEKAMREAETFWMTRLCSRWQAFACFLRGKMKLST